MMTPRRWLALGVGLIVLDVHQRRHGVTASQSARIGFRTHTPRGRIALTGSWLALTAWLLPHLIHHAAAAVEAVGDAIDRADLGD